MEKLRESGEQSPESKPFVFRLRGDPIHAPSYSIPQQLRQSLHESTRYDEWLKYRESEKDEDPHGDLEQSVKWLVGRLNGYFQELILALPQEQDVPDSRKLWLVRCRKTVFDHGAAHRWMYIRTDLLYRQPFASGKLAQLEQHLGFDISKPPLDDLQFFIPQKRIDGIREHVHGSMKYVSGLYDSMQLPDRTIGNRMFPFHYPERE
jgi:hypothetical protein